MITATTFSSALPIANQRKPRSLKANTPTECSRKQEILQIESDFSMWEFTQMGNLAEYAPPRNGIVKGSLDSGEAKQTHNSEAKKEK